MKFKPMFFLIAVFLLAVGVGSAVWAEDVVYLKDGSIIHGTITEEVPGVTIKIETNDGNVFVYKVKQVEKITHSKPDQAGTDNGDNSAAQAAAPAPRKVAQEVNDPHAQFSKFGFLLNLGFWGPGTFNAFNTVLEQGTGSDSYDFLPGYLKGGVGIAWFTNNFGLKWNFEVSLQPNDYSTDWYYGGYYAGTTTEDTYILLGGTELEADIDFDNIVNKNNVTSIYIPLIAGVWEEQYNVSTSDGSDTFTGTTADFGTGVGFRGFDKSNFMWDIQAVFRGCSRGNYLVDSYGYKIPDTKGSYLDADVTGLDLNFTVGFLMQ